jgi:DNA polymerase
MNQLIVIDFETYWDKTYSLRRKNCPIPNYVLDHRFKVLMVGLGELDAAGKWATFLLAPERLPELKAKLESSVVIGHNLAFDAFVLKHRYGIVPRGYIDTLGMANAVLGPKAATGQKNDLGELAKRLGLGEEKGDLKFMCGVSDPTMEQTAQLAEYLAHDISITCRLFDYLRPRFSASGRAEYQIMDRTIQAFVTNPATVDIDKAKEAAAKIEARRCHYETEAGLDRKVLSSNLQFVAALAEKLKAHGLEVPTKKSPRSGKEIPALAKNDDAFKALSTKGPADVQKLVRARLRFRSLTVAKARINKMTAAPAGKLHPFLVYHGAHTGRWAGGGGFQWQNLTDPDRLKEPEEKYVAEVTRDCITAGPGRVFISADYAAIEARVLAWAAGEAQLAEAFRQGSDVYSLFASALLGREVRKPTAKEPLADCARLKADRQLGKAAILGLGYGMGAKKFSLQSRIDRELAEKSVTLYRGKYRSIVAFWANVDRAFKNVLMGENGTTETVWPCTFFKGSDSAVGIKLPSGRVLRYRNVRHLGKDLVWGNKKRLYGGSITENIVQAIARDIMREAILDLNPSGGAFDMHFFASVHDSIYCTVPREFSELAYGILASSMTTVPAWATGLPLSIEGHTSETF